MLTPLFLYADVFRERPPRRERISEQADPFHCFKSPKAANETNNKDNAKQTTKNNGLPG